MRCRAILANFEHRASNIPIFWIHWQGAITLRGVMLYRKTNTERDEYSIYRYIYTVIFEIFNKENEACPGSVSVSSNYPRDLS